MALLVTDPAIDRALNRLKKAPLDPRLRWRQAARPEQLLPTGEWRICYWQGGRGSGKTRSGAGALSEWVLGDTDGEGEYGIVAPTYADAWTKCVEGESGLLRALGTSMAEIKDHRSATVKAAWRTYGQVIMHNGIVVYIDSAAEGGLRIQGRNLKGAWCDEIGLWLNWDVCWNESLKYAVRKGGSQIIATATPKVSRPARKLIRSLIRNEPEHGGVVIRKLKTIDNKDNLSPEFMRAVIGAASGTRLERQELEGELLDDVANALWTREMLENAQCPALGEPGGPAYLRKIFIGVDPSDGEETSDEQAYTVVGAGPVEDRHLYVVENWGGQESPVLFAKRVIKLADWYASQDGTDVTVIVERNHGGAWLKATFKQVMKDLDLHPKVLEVWASQSKRTRAEPVAAMYERRAPDGRPYILHCSTTKLTACDCADGAHPEGHRTPDKHMPELEDQMATFTGAAKERSPDRLDSLVWAATPALTRDFGPPGKSGLKPWAGQQELGRVALTEASAAQRKIQEVHGGHLANGTANWEEELDAFAPKDDETSIGDVAPRTAGRANVRRWG
jgi:phage terminase large subunit-like protein